MPSTKEKLDAAERRLDNLEGKYSNPPYDPKRHIDVTRATIAKVFMWGYLILIAVTLVGVPTYNAIAHKSLDVKELLVTLSSVVGTPFGFIIGYYFKGSDEKRS